MNTHIASTESDIGQFLGLNPTELGIVSTIILVIIFVVLVVLLISLLRWLREKQKKQEQAYIQWYIAHAQRVRDQLDAAPCTCRARKRRYHPQYHATNCPQYRIWRGNGWV